MAQATMATSEDHAITQLVRNKVLYSLSYSYVILELLGCGVFGQVVRCWKRRTSEVVAIKILRNHSSYAHKGEAEMSMLSRLNQEHDIDDFNIVRSFEFFRYNNFTCLVFEILEQTLYDFLEQRSFRSIALSSIQKILQQVLTALLKLKQLGLIHTDIKPQNIMLVDHGRQPFRVKLIDFGNALHVHKTLCSTYLQSRYYRAPEIILGLPFCEAIDMWSLGCVAAELCLGRALYPGKSDFEQIRYISQSQGSPKEDMLNKARNTELYFKRDISASTHRWRLKTTQEYKEEAKISYIEGGSYPSNSIYNLLEEKLVSITMSDKQKFIGLLNAMLNIDPNQRITPGDALNSNFMRLRHLEDYLNFRNTIPQTSTFGNNILPPFSPQQQQPQQQQESHHHNQQSEQISSNFLPSAVTRITQAPPVAHHATVVSPTVSTIQDAGTPLTHSNRYSSTMNILTSWHTPQHTQESPAPPPAHQQQMHLPLQYHQPQQQQESHHHNQQSEQISSNFLPSAVTRITQAPPVAHHATVVSPTVSTIQDAGTPLTHSNRYSSSMNILTSWHTPQHTQESPAPPPAHQQQMHLPLQYHAYNFTTPPPAHNSRYQVINPHSRFRHLSSPQANDGEETTD